MDQRGVVAGGASERCQGLNSFDTMAPSLGGASPVG